MNAELSPFQNGEYSSENASTIDRIITPLSKLWPTTLYSKAEFSRALPFWPYSLHGFLAIDQRHKININPVTAMESLPVSDCLKQINSKLEPVGQHV